MADANTKLLLHCNGIDEAQVFPDSSPSNHNMTAVGNAQVDTAQKKFGTGSLLCDGAGDYLTALDHADWFFGAGKFTIDFWVYFTALPAGGVSAMVSQWDGGASNNKSWVVAYHVDNELLQLTYSTDGAANTLKSVSWVPSTSTWYHIAIVRNNGNLYFFVNGSQVGATQNVGADAFFNSTWKLAIGTAFANTASSAGAELNGHMDEIRISKGVARWTAGFNVSIFEYDTYGVVADAGSYSLGGQIMTPLASRLLPMGAGSYALSGQTMSPLKDSLIPIEAGSYVLTGQDIDFLYSRVIAISAGSYALSGQVASLLKHRLVNIEAGNYILTGKDIAALYNRLITANAGSYTLTGQDAILHMVFILFLYSKLLDSLSKKSVVTDSLSLTSKVTDSIILTSTRENR